MRINTNMSALRSCYQLNRANDRLSASLERLSSGYKINSAEDSKTTYGELVREAKSFNHKVLKNIV